MYFGFAQAFKTFEIRLKANEYFERKKKHKYKA